ncbi:hypothetical protein [Changchengzhania lutea]|uniref:hypothetical protein n=1 Tax=Changchengzhania lutea TaxID=2049305 RepID=UPI00115D4FFC|nr:hypothetical protein [Changchengzhania lutea]
MKTLKTSVLVICILCLSFNFVQAQQSYWIHQDNVKPSKIREYEKIAKEFREACKKHQPDTQWVTAVTNDMTYLYITPMENFAEMDERPFKDMAESMGDDFGNMFERFDTCYDSHGDYVITMDESLTYMPEGISQTQEGMNYRKWFFLYFSPEKEDELREGMKAVKELYTSKDSKGSYRVYRSGFGAMESYYVVVVSAKDEIDAATKGKKNDETLGEERWDVFMKVMGNITRMEEKTGEMRPDLAYMPN